MPNPADDGLLNACAIIDENIRRHGRAFAAQSRPGYRSGMDHYAPDWLAVAVRNAISGYSRKFGREPNLIDPATFNEKIIWSKFFGYKKVPSLRGGADGLDSPRCR